MEVLKPLIQAVIDGAAEPNPGHGGVGVVLIYGEKRREISTYLGDGITNNVAEIMAAITALEALKFPCTVEFISDSQYLVKTMNGEFKRGANMDYWNKLDAAIAAGDHDVLEVGARS